MKLGIPSNSESIERSAPDQRLVRAIISGMDTEVVASLNYMYDQMPTIKRVGAAKHTAAIGQLVDKVFFKPLTIYGPDAISAQLAHAAIPAQQELSDAQEAS